MIYLLQQGDYMRKEKSAIINADLPRETCIFDNLSLLSDEHYVPVGTVEFVNTFCRYKHIHIPENISYPDELLPFLGRDIWTEEFGNVSGSFFVKPKNTKMFTGSIKQEITEPVKDSEPVWVSHPLQFTQEYRYYIIDKHVVGYSRYDDGDDVDIVPPISFIEQMVSAYKTQPAGYSIDIGICDGQPLLIEVNDGWALGFYPWGTMKSGKYIELITKRWLQIERTKHFLLP